MRLRRPCEHVSVEFPEGHYDAHSLYPFTQKPGICPGGEFLPEDADLTAEQIERALARPGSDQGTVTAAAFAYLRILAADQVGEPG